MAFVKSMMCVSSLNSVGGVLECVCRRRAAAESGEYESDVDRWETANSCTAAGEWFGTIFSESILSILHIFRANIVVLLLTAELPWNGHRFYNNTFFQESKMSGKKNMIKKTLIEMR